MRGLIRSQADLVVASLMLLAVPWLVAFLIFSGTAFHIDKTGYGFSISGPVRLKGFPRKVVRVEPGDRVEWIKAEGLPDWRGDKPCGDEVYPRMVFPLPSAPCGAPVFAVSTRNITAKELDERASVSWPSFTWQKAQGQYQVTKKGWLYIWYNKSWWLKCEYWSFKKGIASGCPEGTYRLYKRYYYETPNQKARWSFKIFRGNN